MIRLENVSSGYGKSTILRDVSLHVRDGEMVGVLGPNGGGKSTLLKTISGVLPTTGGRISIAGEALEDLALKERARRMAAVPQQMDVPHDLRVLPLVLMGRYPYISFLGGYGAEDEQAAFEAMRETRTETFAQRRLGELSGGELQRAVIARALAQQAQVLLLDEAASGLDIARKVEIYDLLKERNRKGATVLSVIHDLNLAALYCERLVFVKQGRITLDGPTRDVFTANNLSEIYETRIIVAPHPETGAPQSHMAPAFGGVARS